MKTVTLALALLVGAALCVTLASAEKGSFDGLPQHGEDDEVEEIVVGEDDKSPLFLDKKERMAMKDKVESMFYHAYESYMLWAFPADEIKPLTCKGKDVMGGLSLTLIDTLDTLLVMGNEDEYVKQARWIIDNISFDRDEVVVTFEANIRFVGALISAHLVCVDEELNIMPDYNDEFLEIVVDAADRLMRAFETETGLPMKKINLRKGLPDDLDDRPYFTSVADAGTYLMEFGMLSHLTGDEKYISAAKNAARKIYDSRSDKNLIGTNLNLENGQWEMKISNTGSGVDSYFEYLIKYSVLFNDTTTLRMFRKLYKGVKKHLKQGPWYFTADMDTGEIGAPYFNSLQAFWPGLQTLLNDSKQLDDAIETLSAYVGLFQHYGFLPEQTDVYRDHILDARCALRPELGESMWYMWKATENPIWPLLAKDMVDNIDNYARVPCGFATIKNVRKKTLNDQMESFFLGETLKYLYMIYDEAPVIGTWRGKSNVVYNTEAHPMWIPHYKTMKERRAAEAAAAAAESA